MFIDLLDYLSVFLKRYYPFSFKIIFYLYTEYSKILMGNLEANHLKLFILIGIILKDEDYFKWFLLCF